LARGRRARQRDLAYQRVQRLLSLALEMAREDMKLARRMAAIAWRMKLRYTLRLPWELRRLYCRGCKGFLVPGVNARVRLGGRPPSLKITCLDCGHIYRRPIRAG
jgi:ribonuclease P protein subunit RPR2